MYAIITEIHVCACMGMRHVHKRIYEHIHAYMHTGGAHLAPAWTRGPYEKQESAVGTPFQSLPVTLPNVDNHAHGVRVVRDSIYVSMNVCVCISMDVCVRLCVVGTPFSVFASHIIQRR